MRGEGDEEARPKQDPPDDLRMDLEDEEREGRIDNDRNALNDADSTEPTDAEPPDAAITVEESKTGDDTPNRRRTPPLKTTFRVGGKEVGVFLDTGIYGWTLHGFIQKSLADALKLPPLEGISSGTISSTTGHSVKCGPAVRLELHPELPEVHLEVVEGALTGHDIALGLRWMQEMQQKVGMNFDLIGGTLKWRGWKSKTPQSTEAKQRVVMPELAEVEEAIAIINEVQVDSTLILELQAGDRLEEVEKATLLFCFETTEVPKEKPKEKPLGERLAFFLRHLDEAEKSEVLQVIEDGLEALHRKYDEKVIVDQLPDGDTVDRETDHRVNLIPGASLPPPARFGYDPITKTKINALVSTLLEKQHIRPSKSPVAAACFLVAQKGKERLVIDYRGINAITEDVAISMPTIEHILSMAADSGILDRKSVV